MPVISERDKLFPKIVELNEQGMTIAEAAEVVGVHPVTVTKWQRQTGIRLIQRKGNRTDRDGHNQINCTQCGKTFRAPKSQKRRFCSRDCTNDWQRAQVEARMCQGCGKPLELQEGATTMYTYRKFCSKECRIKYGTKRQTDESKWQDYVCEVCGETFRRRKSSKNPNRFCSISCANKVTKVVKHYVVRDIDMVLDSSWEALFAGLMGFLKVPCERFDRADQVMWKSGCPYGPDFYLPDLDLYVEVKGYPDNDDPARWEAFRATSRSLLVLLRDDLDRVRRAASSTEVLALLRELHASAKEA